jgi:hypothetical protein
MNRRLFNFITLVSLLMCLAATVLWVRSYWSSDSIIREGPAETLVGSESGQLVLNRSYPGEAGRATAPGWRFQTFPTPEREEFVYTNGRQFRYRALGFEIASYRPIPHTMWASGIPFTSVRYWTAGVPHWFAVGVLALPPALWLRRRQRRRHARRAGLCASCGYDLRASPGRCPECGAAASVTTSE